MKIKRLHTQVAVMSIDHKFSFDASQHKLAYRADLSMFKIDNTYVPVSNIREVLVEEEVEKEQLDVSNDNTLSSSNCSDVAVAQQIVRRKRRIVQ